MKKFFIIFWIIIITSAAFAKEFPQLGKFKNVKVTGITWMGIKIKHSGGSCYITDKDLSAEEQKLLEQELKEWETKAAKHARRKNLTDDVRKKQESILKEFLLSVPKMSEDEISDWCTKHIRTTPFDQNFQSSFFKKFNYAGNAKEAIDACITRLRSLETIEFLEIADACRKKKPEELPDFILQETGISLMDPVFPDRISYLFPWVESQIKKDFLNYLKEIREKIAKARKEAEEERRKNDLVLLGAENGCPLCNGKGTYSPGVGEEEVPCGKCKGLKRESSGESSGGSGGGASYGGERRYESPTHTRCPACNGTGGTTYYDNTGGIRIPKKIYCGTCGGFGMIRR